MSNQTLRELLAGLQGDAPAESAIAATLLARAARQPEAVAEALLSVPRPNLPTRRVLARVLRVIAPAGKAGLPVLADMLTDPNEDEELRCVAGEAIGQFRDAAHDLLLGLCAHPDDFVRARALRVLANIGDYSDRVSRVMLRALLDPDPNVRAVAVTALSRCVDGQVLPTLRAALEDPNTAVRVGAAHALLTYDRADADALRAAVAGIDDDAPAVRAAACDAVAAAKQNARSALARSATRWRTTTPGSAPAPPTR